MSMVICPNTIMYPWTMTGSRKLRVLVLSLRLNPLVFLRNATLASFAMFATQRPPDQTLHAKILFVKLPQAEQLFHNRLLLSAASRIWYKSRVFDHAYGIEVRAKTVRNSKQHVQKRI